MTANTSAPPLRNLLLEALLPKHLALITPYLSERQCRRGDVLFEVGEDVECISFPMGQTVATLVITMQDGRSVDVATVGREGAIGGVVSQGYLPAFSRAVVQLAGPVLQIEASRVQEAKKASPPLRNLFTRYSDCLLAQVLQSVACNALHSIEQRCARHLLTLHDRLGSAVLPLTHEMLAEQLGIQRSYLTRVLKSLRGEGLIEVGRSRVVISDPAALEATACECHGAVKQHFARVLGAVYDDHGRMIAVAPQRADALV